MQQTRSTSSESPRAQSIELANRPLAAAIDPRGQTNQAQWNARGPSFIALYELFHKISLEIGACSDLLAPRVGGLDEMSAAAELGACGQSARGTIGLASRIDDAGRTDALSQTPRDVEQQPLFVAVHGTHAESRRYCLSSYPHESSGTPTSPRETMRSFDRAEACHVASEAHGRIESRVNESGAAGEVRQ